MTPKQARLGVDIFTATVIASVALAFAGLTWRLQGYAGNSPVAAPVTPGAGATDVELVLALAPFGTTSGAVVDTGGSALTLRAIFAAVDPSKSVALIAGADGQVVAFAVGETTPGGIVETIEPEQVMLRTGTGLRILSFNPDAAAPSTGSPATPATGSPVAGTAPPPPVRPSPAPVGVDAIRALIPPAAQNGAQNAPPPSTAPIPPPPPSVAPPPR